MTFLFFFFFVTFRCLGITVQKQNSYFCAIMRPSHVNYLMDNAFERTFKKSEEFE